MAAAPPSIIGRDAASALGLKRFFTGEPCRHGHIVERSVSDSGCMECSREHTRKYRAADPERARENWRRWRAANPDGPQKDRERNRLHYAKNKDRILSERAAKRAADPEKAREYLRVWRAANKDKISKRQAAQRTYTWVNRPTFPRGSSIRGARSEITHRRARPGREIG